ncbi:hypothetical protein ACFS6H_19970 [Terrimonas rubra]|uniref:Uncharacterized protein n=1 Tax=Terrimonas rubra TaxID=1035890 RepID=A0ABW6ACV2_9BACT
MVWKYIKAEPFFADFLPHIKNHRYKIVGRNTKGNPLTFSPDEEKQIRKKLAELSPFLKNMPLSKS